MYQPATALLLGLVACSDYEVQATKEPAEPGAPPTCELVAEAGRVPTDASCVVEPVVGSFTPVVEWEWRASVAFPGYDQIMTTPAVANLDDDDGDGDIDADDVPEIVFTTFSGGAYGSPGVLTAASGDGAGELWSIYEAGGYHIHASTQAAIGDIDADGVPEVCVSGVEVAVLCVTNTGAFKWAAGTELYGYGGPSFADLDGDGRSEVIYGRTVFDAAGTVLASGVDGAGWYLSFAADLDDDGQPEIVAGNTAYRADGTTLWTDGTGDGPGAVADFDLDGLPEVVHVTSGTVVLTGGNGIVWWTASIPGGGGGPPTIADFDADGFPEIGVAGASYYSVFDTDGSVLWSDAVQDYSSSVTGSSVFDFEGDGAADVVYADEVTLWVYDGATGTVKFQLDDHASGTLFEYPLIVDVDNDGSTEIVLGSNNYAFPGWTGITVIGDLNNSWRPSRPVWNQFAYSITNVNDDGSIPAEQAPNWERYNTFRAGGTTLGLSSELANLTAGAPRICTETCDDDEASFVIPVQNTGLADATSFVVGIYSAGGGPALATQTVSLEAGTSAEIGPFVLARTEWEEVLWVRIDDAGAVEECDEDDNAVSVGSWPCD